MARRRKPEAAPLDDEPPDWFWEFDGRLWGWHSKNLRSCKGQIEGHHDAQMEWHKACRQWLNERGLVAWHCGGVSWQEFKRIEREEPHRVLRRPERRGAAVQPCSTDCTQ